MSRLAILTAAGVAGVADALSISSASSSRVSTVLGTGMQPDVVAHSLAAVEDEWASQAALYADCEARGNQEALAVCVGARENFKTSCAMVVTALVQGSSGDKDAVNEYLGDVCNEKVLTAWHKGRCVKLTDAVSEIMTEDTFLNRAKMQTAGLCKNMWSDVLKEEKQRMAEVHKAVAEPKPKHVEVNQAKVDTPELNQAPFPVHWEDSSVKADGKARVEQSSKGTQTLPVAPTITVKAAEGRKTPKAQEAILPPVPEVKDAKTNSTKPL